MSVGKFDQITLGDSYTLEKTITEQMVWDFADLSGDYNPIHMDEEYCRQKGLNSRLVHGMLTLSFLSTLIGMYLPGNGAVWMSQAIDFISPVSIDDTIRITGTVIKKDNSNTLSLNIIEIKIDIKNQLNRRIARGHVKVSVK